MEAIRIFLSTAAKTFMILAGKGLDALRPHRGTIVIMVDGGLASQINKYLLGALLKKKLKTNVAFDLSWYIDYGKALDGVNNRNFDLTRVFEGLNFRKACKSESLAARKLNYYANAYPLFEETSHSHPKSGYIDGYFTHLRVYHQAGLPKMRFSTEIIQVNQGELERIFERGNHPVAVHVRRGDYLNTVHDVLDEGYFAAAISRMIQELSPDARPHFVFFSNDPEWVRERLLPQLDPSVDCIVMDQNDNDAGGNDFYLMTQCSHQICSNSGFSYFAAFFNQNPEKKVIIPRIWMKQEFDAYDVSGDAVCLPGWILL